MNLKKHILVMSLIGIQSIYANGALSQGVDGHGPFKSAIPVSKNSLKVSYGNRFGSYDAKTIDSVYNVSNGTAIPDPSAAFSLADHNFSVSYGILDWLEVSAFLPTYSDKLNGKAMGIVNGDPIVGLKLNYPPYGNPGKRAYELSYLGQISIPIQKDGNPQTSNWGLPRNSWNARDTGSMTTLDPYHTNDPIIMMSLLNTINFSAIKGSVPLMIHYNGGLVMGVGSNKQQTTVQGGLGLEFWTEYFGFYANAETEVATSKTQYGVPFDKYPINLKVGPLLKYNVDRTALEFTFGYSKLFNVKPAYMLSAVTETETFKVSRQPASSFFGGVSVAFDFSPKDSDRDGIIDVDDKCPSTLEGAPVDAYGCPVPDADKDGVCDAWVSAKGQLGMFINQCKGIDKCAAEAEDKDGFEDDDGCPDADNDGDKICDAWVTEKGLSAQYTSICTSVDKCSNDTEDMDNFEDDDGCPDADNDKDGVQDNLDQCPNEAEDKDNVQDDDGCPDADNDGDKICDAWVAEKGLSAQFSNVCTGTDKCQSKWGKSTNNGCP